LKIYPLCINYGKCRDTLNKRANSNDATFFHSVPPSALTDDLLQKLLDTVPSAVAHVSRDGDWLFANAAAHALWGLRPQNNAPTTMTQSRVSAGVLAAFHQALAQGETVTLEEQVHLGGPTTNARWMRVLVVPDTCPRTHDVLAVRLVASDIDETVKAQRTAQAREDLIREHLDQGLVAFVQLGPRFQIERWSGAMERMLGWSAAEAIGKTPMQINAIYPDDIQTVNQASQEVLTSTTNTRTYRRTRNLTKDGRMLWCDWYGTRVRNPETGESSVLLFGVDVTERVHANNQMRRNARQDALTTLPNRYSLFEWLQNRLDIAHTPGSLFFIDLDGFKEVNDRHGHECGDLLLTKVAAALREQLHDAEFIARHGGDEFVLVHGAHTSADTQLVANRITAALRGPYLLEELSVDLSCSVGIALAPEHGQDSHTLIKAADLAMYQAKTNGKDQYALFTLAIGQAQQRRNEMYLGLRDALRAKKIEVHYQPRVCIETGSIRGVEALARWRNDGLTPVSPGEFIPVAEETGLIHELGANVMHEAFLFAGQVNRTRAPGTLPFIVSVNVSGLQLRYERFVEQVEFLLEITQCSAAWLDFEVTESSSIVEPLLMERLRDLAYRVGIRCSLDDFGTGYSNLSELSKLPIRAIKIDRTFVSDLSPQRDAVVTAIIALGRSFSLEVVAEGVETQLQLEQLRRLGCDSYQGYLHSAPMRKTDLLAHFDLAK
jgi:diguanylate cyclase (GGDEF)-like protein/PAS domain S-box-containing protein